MQQSFLSKLVQQCAPSVYPLMMQTLMLFLSNLCFISTDDADTHASARHRIELGHLIAMDIAEGQL